MKSETDIKSDDNNLSTRLFDYKCRTWKNNQESRRHLLLKEQKKRREASFDAFRDFDDVFTVNDDHVDVEDDFMDVCCSDSVHEKEEKPSFPKLKHLFMFSEWMTEIPVDFQEKWLFMLCPVGKRCLVRSFKGSTTVYAKSGYRLAKFRSALPNGGIHCSYGSKYCNSAITVLDCIWNSAVQKYYILDVLYWKDQSYLDTDIAFRSFWIRSKILEEIPSILERSKKNPYPFIPLSYHNCNIVTLSAIMSRYPYFESDEPQVDGVIFHHSESYYTPGMSPLVLWLKPYMLPEMLGQNVCIAEQYYNTRPIGYTNIFDFISHYENLRKQKPKKRGGRRKNRITESEKMEECPPESVYENRNFDHIGISVVLKSGDQDHFFSRPKSSGWHRLGELFLDRCLLFLIPVVLLFQLRMSHQVTSASVDIYMTELLNSPDGLKKERNIERKR